MLFPGILLGVTGALLAALNKANAANVVWSVSSILLAYRAYTMGDFDSVLLFGVYEVIALFGVARYLKERSKNKASDCSVD